MQANVDNEQENIETRSTFSKLLTLVLVYLFLTFSSRYSEHQSHHGLAISEKIGNTSQNLTLREVGTLFQYDQIYSGEWARKGSGKSIGLVQQQGQLQIVLSRVMGTRNQRFILRLSLSNGEYIDQGVLDIAMLLDTNNFTSTRPDSKSIALMMNPQKEVDASYTYTKLLLIEGEGPLLVKSFSIIFSTGETNKLTSRMQVEFEERDKNKTGIKMDEDGKTLPVTALNIQVQSHQSRLIGLIIFAVVLFLTSYMPFTAAIELLKQFYEDRSNPLHYSLLTITIATMWDTVMCMVSFKMAFNDQESLVLFLLPAFILCLLFTNIQPRLMFVIYERSQLPNQRGFCNIFNMVSYGSMILIYPILVVTNLNRWLFIGVSCLVFPQIYLNAVRGNRPDYHSEYYLKFLLSRFLMVAYLRCFPYNVFDLQPDYGLGFTCLALLFVQMGLLRVQSRYGPKVVVPKWMLQPVYDYNFQEMLNLEEGGEDSDCSICLVSLRTEPPEGEGEVELPFRIMKTPCKHNYHSSCLIAWMKIKMQCPQCRTALPPFE